MRLPNSYGTVSLIDKKSKRRKPYVVKIHTGWTDEGKAIRKTLGYAETRKKGYQMLADYHNKPYDLNADLISFSTLYEKWFDYKKKKVGDKVVKSYTCMRKHYQDLENEPFNNISGGQLQDIINKTNLTVDYQRKIISIYSQMHRYAVGNNIKVGSDVSQFIVYKKGKETTCRKPFTDKEINILWEHRNDVIDMLLVMIYTGLRPNELINYSEVHENYIITGSKTESGKDRVVPLHNKIKDIFHSLIKNNIISKHSTPDLLYHAIKKQLKLLDMGYHVPYEGRHTFATLCKRAKVDDYSRKLIMGHKITDLTDRVYTHKLIEELIEEVNKI